MGRSRKYPYPYDGRHFGNPKGRGGLWFWNSKGEGGLYDLGIPRERGDTVEEIQEIVCVDKTNFDRHTKIKIHDTKSDYQTV